MFVTTGDHKLYCYLYSSVLVVPCKNRCVDKSLTIQDFNPINYIGSKVKIFPNRIFFNNDSYPYKEESLLIFDVSFIKKQRSLAIDYHQTMVKEIVNSYFLDLSEFISWDFKTPRYPMFYGDFSDICYLEGFRDIKVTWLHETNSNQDYLQFCTENNVKLYVPVSIASEVEYDSID
ncbi:MAG: hypothetical protein ACK4GR_04320 [bacterium]